MGLWGSRCRRYMLGCMVVKVPGGRRYMGRVCEGREVYGSGYGDSRVSGEVVWRGCVYKAMGMVEGEVW